MHRIAVSVLFALGTMSAYADARLPVVNVSSASVSARAAFGEGVGATAPVANSVATAKPAVQPTAMAPAKQRNVVARSAVKTTPKKDSNKIAADLSVGADVLSPRRPSADLWARSADAPLRMPDVEEFSVYRADYQLPEESIDTATAPRASAPVVADSGMSELDAQIAHLVELQRRADESVRAGAISDVKNVATRRPADITIASAAPMVPDVVESGPVTVRRMVVPADVPVAPVATPVAVNNAPHTSNAIVSTREDMTKMSPTELRKAFRKTFLSENKHLSTFQIDDRFDVVSDMSVGTEGFTAKSDLSESAGIRTLEIKINFRDDDSALSRDNYTLLTEYASIVVNNPKRAIQVSIPQRVATDSDARRLAARRLAIVEQVLRDTGVAEKRIVPVLANRDGDGFVLRIISNDQFETLTQQQRDMFGDTVSKKTYKSMSW